MKQYISTVSVESDLKINCTPNKAKHMCLRGTTKIALHLFIFSD